MSMFPIRFDDEDEDDEETETDAKAEVAAKYPKQEDRLFKARTILI